MTQTKRRSTADAPKVRRGDGDPPGRIGSWEPVALAGEGSLSLVYCARPADALPDRSPCYALKMLRPEWCDHPWAVQLLQREALVGRSISHPHLVSVLAANVTAPPRFLIMPWLEGSTLQAHLAAARPIDLPTALGIVRQVAQALEPLAAAGWMHGDVKPGNIFISPEGHVTLLDLGFARRSHETGSAADRYVVGTCSYMAPELITSTLRADIRSDIYSLGAVLFELLSGRPPFDGRTLAELAGRHKQAAPPNLASLAAHLPPEVVRLVHQMLAKDPLRRPDGPDELVQRLTRLEIAMFSERVLV